MLLAGSKELKELIGQEVFGHAVGNEREGAEAERGGGSAGGLLPWRVLPVKRPGNVFSQIRSVF